MRTKTVAVTAALLAVTGLGATSQAQSPAPVKWAAPAPPPAPGPFDEFAQEAKQPVAWFKWGGDLRIRNEYYDNIVTLKDAGKLAEQDVVRYRARIWASLIPVTDLSLNARLSAEPRLWVRPSFVGAFKSESGMEWRYGIVDNLNVKWSNIFDQPLAVTAGRQDILLGDYYDWWLVADGTPNDGSWSLYLDSIRLTAEAKPIKTKFELIYIHQNPEPSEWLPTIDNSSNYPVTDQREQGVIAYASNKSIANVQLDGYFIYKRDDQVTFDIAGAKKQPGDDANIYTLGGKITGTPSAHWRYSAEGAYQLGDKRDRIVENGTAVVAARTIDAYGGKCQLTYLCQDPFDNQLSLVGEFLSGDNPNTDRKDEMFDVLWGRWPRWSELYIYSYINETGGRIAQMNNLGRIGPCWTCTPLKKTNLSLMYNALLAPEQTPTRTVAPALFSNNGNFRGHYLQAVLKYQLNKYVAAHLWGEWVWEGDYYTQRDTLMFLRAEVLFTF